MINKNTYLYREYSDEEIDEILSNISSKLNKLRNNTNVEYYSNLMEYYQYLTELKRKRNYERLVTEKIMSQNEPIETDPILKEKEIMMKKELEEIEKDNDENYDEEYSDD